jgi:Carboxypeptidase regulatory-like domain/TonB dependent receptor
MSMVCARLCRSALGVVLFAALTIFSAATMVGQTAGTGAIAGTISDSTGAVVRDVKVTVTSVDTGQARTATTAADGAYTVGLLPPGNYKIKMEATGFKGVEIPSVVVTVTETNVVSRTLEVGNASQSVTVEEAVETVQTTSSTMGTVADSRTITEIPLNTRNYTNLLTMTAGANSSVSNATTVGKGSPLIAVNGAGTSQNTYLQDGVVINNWYSFNTGTEGVAFGSFVLPIPDAIAEFKIQTSSYDAGYGRGPGASVNVVTKTGTNQFHGDGFEFFRNTALNANDWFRNFKGLPKGTLNSNQYGGVIGGPIKKDKIFFFASYQETGQKNGLTGYGSSTVQLPPIPGGNRGTCPTNATIITQCDAAGQAFITNLASAVCPANHPGATGDVTSNGGLNVACPGSGTGDSFYNLNPIAISILQLKLPNGNFAVPGSGLADTATGGGYGVNTYSDPAIFKDHNLMGNVDYIINQKHTLAVRYQYEKDPLSAPFPVLNANLAGNFLPGNPTTTDKWNHAAAVKLTTILNATMVNEAHIAYQFNGVYDTTNTPFTNSQVGIKSLEPGKDNISDFTIGSGQSGFNFGSQYQFDLTSHDAQYNWGDQFSWTKGKHTIRAGFEMEHVRFTTIYPGHAIGNPTFTRFADFLVGRGSCQVFTGTGTCSTTNPGNTNGSTASNISTIGNFTSGPATTTHWLWRAHEAAAFLQDDFKFSPRLTINAGIRWEYDGLPYTDNGIFSGFFPYLQTKGVLPSCPVVVGAGCSTSAGTLAGYALPGNYSGTIPAGLGLTVYNNNGLTANGSPWTDFAPRVGFAWQPTNSPKWVIRGGGGVFYDLVAGAAFLNYALTSSPAVGSPQLTGPGISLQNLFIRSSPVSAGGTGYGFSPLWVNPGNLTTTPVSSNLSISSTDPDLTVPTTYQWNINTQYEFLPAWLIEVAYVGAHGIHQGAESASAQQGQISTFIGDNIAPLVGPDCVSCSVYGVTTNTVQNVVLRVPQPGVSAQNAVLGTRESYKFNGLEVTLKKQMSHGFQLQGSYTHSRAFITLPFGINTSPYIVHVYGPNNNYRPERFVLNYVWNIPGGKSKGMLNKIIGDWALSGVTTAQSGSFLTITDTGGSIFLGGTGAPNSSTGAYSTAQLAAGKTYADLLSSGSIQSRVTSGLIGGAGNYGYFTGGSSVAGSALIPTIAFNPDGTRTTAAACPSCGRGFGNMGIGAVTGPGQFNFDASLSKTIHIGEKQTVQFRAEFFNIFNHAQFSNPGLGANQATFGQITSTSVSPRVIQFALKYTF